MAHEGGFLSRWAQRKAQVQSGVATVAEPVEAPARVAPPASPDTTAVEAVPAAEPPPTLADVALLTRESDYSRFVAADVDEGVKRAAMKKLFTDPHYNIMDGLDIYIDDYGLPDPIPESMLRQMTQSKFLGLFDHEEEPPAPAASTDGETAHPVPQSAPEPDPVSDENADLRLQQDDAAGRPGPDQGAEPHLRA